MKKLLVIAAALLGTAAASQAGVSVHIGIPLPPLPHIVIARPAPPPRVCAPPAVVYAPPPPIVYAPPVAYGYRHPHYHRYYRGCGHHH